MLEVLKRFQADSSGQGLVEYALIVALVAVALIAVIIVFRDAVAVVFGLVSDTLNETPICGQKGRSHRCF